MKHREFWIEVGLLGLHASENKSRLHGWTANGEGPFHVVEKSALDQALEREEKLIAALVFYGNENNWIHTGTGWALEWVDKINNDSEKFVVICGKSNMIGGKTARQALEENRKLRGE